MEVAIVNIEGKETGKTVALPDELFSLENPSDQAIFQHVRLIMANERRGTHKSKERGEVSGSNKKPYKQKGTGSARAGHKRSPLWRHGGTIFGPRPRNYGFKLNKKVKSLARASALTYKAREDKVVVVENFNLDQPKTKDVLNVLKNLSLDSTKVLFVLGNQDRNIYLSGRNLPKLQLTRSDSLNTYDIMNADVLLFLEEEAKQLKEKFVK